MKINGTQQFIAILIVFGILGILIFMNVDWDKWEYSEWVRRDAIEMFAVAIAMSIALPLSVGVIVNHFKEGWKRLSFLVMGLGSIIGIFFFLSELAVDDPFTGIIWGAIAGIAISSSAIAIPYIAFNWIKRGFSSDTRDSISDEGSN